jgi:hypothetical protein
MDSTKEIKKPRNKQTDAKEDTECDRSQQKKACFLAFLEKIQNCEQILEKSDI